MVELVWALARSVGQIFMFDYFHKENSYSMISKINMVTFFILIIYKAIKYKMMHHDNLHRIISAENIPYLILLVVLTFINQSFYVFNLVTYSFIVIDLGDQLYAMASYYMRLSTGQEKEKRYRNGYLTVLQVILVAVVFGMDVELDNLVMGAFFVSIEILTKSLRFKILKKRALDQVPLDFASIVLSLGIHIAVAISNAISSDLSDKNSDQGQQESKEEFFHYKGLFQLLGFIAILVLFSITNNDGLKAKKTKNFNRNQYQSLILWGLLILNKYMDPQEMEWSSWTLIILYGILGILELYNIKEEEDDGLLISTNTQHLSKIESYSEISMKNFILHIKRNKDSKKLLILLAMNFSFMFVELIYGVISNSLSLIGDSAHMLFDSSALAIGLYASFMSKLQPSLLFSFGYERFQVISGFVNGLFLLFIAFDIFVESIERIFKPQVVYSEKMMVVSILGLLINFVGLCFFSEHAHQGCVEHNHGSGETHGEHQHCHSHEEPKEKKSCSHGHDHSHNHKHDHDHDHKHDHEHEHSHEHNENHHHHDHDHSHGGHSHSHNENLSGVFLHILADTLGSVGVIISSILIQWYQWYISDPIMSFIISLLIFVSIIPLVKSSTLILLQTYQPHQAPLLKTFTKKLSEMNEVVSYTNLKFYSYTSDAAVLTVKVYVKSNVNQQYALEKIQDIVKRIGKIKYYNIEITKVSPIEYSQTEQQIRIDEDEEEKQTLKYSGSNKNGQKATQKYSKINNKEDEDDEEELLGNKDEEPNQKQNNIFDDNTDNDDIFSGIQNSDNGKQEKKQQIQGTDKIIDNSSSATLQSTQNQEKQLENSQQNELDSNKEQQQQVLEEQNEVENESDNLIETHQKESIQQEEDEEEQERLNKSASSNQEEQLQEEQQEEAVEEEEEIKEKNSPSQKSESDAI